MTGWGFNKNIIFAADYETKTTEWYENSIDRIWQDGQDD